MDKRGQVQAIATRAIYTAILFVVVWASLIALNNSTEQPLAAPDLRCLQFAEQGGYIGTIDYNSKCPNFASQETGSNDLGNNPPILRESFEGDLWRVTMDFKNGDSVQSDLIVCQDIFKKYLFNTKIANTPIPSETQTFLDKIKRNDGSLTLCNGGLIRYGHSDGKISRLDYSLNMVGSKNSQYIFISPSIDKEGKVYGSWDAYNVAADVDSFSYSYGASSNSLIDKDLVGAKALFIFIFRNGENALPLSADVTLTNLGRRAIMDEKGRVGIYTDTIASQGSTSYSP